MKKMDKIDVEDLQIKQYEQVVNNGKVLLTKRFLDVTHIPIFIINEYCNIRNYEMELFGDRVLIPIMERRELI